MSGSRNLHSHVRGGPRGLQALPNDSSVTEPTDAASRLPVTGPCRTQCARTKATTAITSTAPINAKVRFIHLGKFGPGSSSAGTALCLMTAPRVVLPDCRFVPKAEVALVRSARVIIVVLLVLAGCWGKSSNV